MLSGKTLYSQIFYNHIMGMAWLSFFIQKFHQAINIYDLVLFHRQIIMVIAFMFDLLIIKRFKWTGLWFVLFYEFSKFYVFGDRFLGESIVVYACVFLFGLVFEKFLRHKLSPTDLVLSGIFTFLVIFMREPYIPLIVFLYGIILWGSVGKAKIASVFVFLILIGVVLLNTSLPDFYFNDVTLNKILIENEASSNSVAGVGFFQVFLYPVSIFLYGKLNAFRFFEITLSVVFLTGIIFEFFKNKKKMLVAIVLIALGIANLRITPPGSTYFEAYHQMVWLGMFIFASVILCMEVIKRKKIRGALLGILITVGWGAAVFGPGSYVYDKVDLQEQLLTNFGTVMNVGTVVRNLSDTSDTLFLDGADDMIYWQSGLYSPYEYSWYTSLMRSVPLYIEERTNMFKNNPPVFYYDFCTPLAPTHNSLPGFVKNKYQQLYNNGKPSCLYVLKTKVPNISQQQWEKAKQGFYGLP